ncbi:MAG: hypothetical protein A4E48_00747 [Methanosaeta sp. PtaU1.Bin060]|nr:MAG: hypothetical protein A4E48_00747 [Methanosaeta sp. PtaU1.Bin060]
MSDEDLRRSIEAVRNQIGQLKDGWPSERLYKIAVYVESIGKSWDALHAASSSLAKEGAADPGGPALQAESFRASAKNSLRFARINLDAALMEALDSVVKRPRSANKSDEQKKTLALKRVFDGSPEPDKSMLQQYCVSSDPLDKWLIAGPWGHDYLRKRAIDIGAYDIKLCKMLSCEETAAGRIILSYSDLSKALDALEECALRSSEAL